MRRIPCWCLWHWWRFPRFLQKWHLTSTQAVTCRILWLIECAVILMTCTNEINGLYPGRRCPQLVFEKTPEHWEFFWEPEWKRINSPKELCSSHYCWRFICSWICQPHACSCAGSHFIILQSLWRHIKMIHCPSLINDRDSPVSLELGCSK